MYLLLPHAQLAALDSNAEKAKATLQHYSFLNSNWMKFFLTCHGLSLKRMMIDSHHEKDDVSQLQKHSLLLEEKSYPQLLQVVLVKPPR